MTDNEIIKALECCAKRTTSDVCSDCPLRFSDICTEEENGVVKLALGLINRQQAEIERLEKIRKADNNLITSLNKCYETAKAEAIKEFAERLKKKCYEDFQETYEMLSPYVTDDDIDNLLKEMEGEE